MKRLIVCILMLTAVSVSTHAGRKDWKIGLQCYTFNHLTLVETIDYAAVTGIKHLEVYPGQVLGAGFEGKLHHSMSAPERIKLQELLKDKGISLVSYGCVKGADEAEWRSIFDFARMMGIQYIISEPPQEHMELLDKLTEEYGIGVGVHNHRTPTPDEVAKLLDGRSDRISIAPDNGHWTRAGFDNIASLKKFEGRIVSIHLKDLNTKKQDVPYGEGQSPIAGILEYLDKVDYKGNVIIEYESGNEIEQVKKCYEYLKIFVATGKTAASTAGGK